MRATAKLETSCTYPAWTGRAADCGDDVLLVLPLPLAFLARIVERVSSSTVVNSACGLFSLSRSRVECENRRGSDSCTILTRSSCSTRRVQCSRGARSPARGGSLLSFIIFLSFSLSLFLHFSPSAVRPPYVFFANTVAYIRRGTDGSRPETAVRSTLFLSPFHCSRRIEFYSLSPASLCFSARPRVFLRYSFGRRVSVCESALGRLSARRFARVCANRTAADEDGVRECA